MGILLLRKSRLTKGLCWHNFTWQGRWQCTRVVQGCNLHRQTFKTYICIEFVNLWIGENDWFSATILCTYVICQYFLTPSIWKVLHCPYSHTIHAMTVLNRSCCLWSMQNAEGLIKGRVFFSSTSSIHEQDQKTGAW